MPVTRVEIEERAPLAAGRSFGASGPYEYLTGVLHFASDPKHPGNKAICDLNLAPTNPRGTRRAPRAIPSAEAGRTQAARPCDRRLDQSREHDRGGDIQQRGAPHGRQSRRRSRQRIPVPPRLQRALDRRAVGSAGIARAHASVVSGGARKRSARARPELRAVVAQQAHAASTAFGCGSQALSDGRHQRSECGAHGARPSGRRADRHSA